MDIENKLGMSLDDLIQQQKKKPPAAKKTPAKKTPARRSAPAKTAPRNQGRKYVPIPADQLQQAASQRRAGQAAGAVNRVRGGGVRKQQAAAPKFLGRPVGGGAAARGRTMPVPTRPRNMKIVISNNARAPTQPPPDFLAGSRGGGGGGRGGNGFAPMVVEDAYRQGASRGGRAGGAPAMAAPPPGSSLSARFDKLAGSVTGRGGGAPAAGRAGGASGGGQRRNAHGVVLP